MSIQGAAASASARTGQSSNDVKCYKSQQEKIAKTASVIKEVFLEEMYFVLALEPVRK